ncbi:MAG: hypothetical protein QOE61_4860 [Micromonosporaceae bacterium]|jgi:iron uptake system component EfeO|nr:hypothetical protein [Micromonosporaceae bacterium]
MPYRPFLSTAAVGLVVGLTACGKDTAASAGGVAITATDSTCEVATTSFAPGKATFTVTNKGSQVTEVYLYGEHAGTYTKVISEVENIGPGLTRELAADLSGGQYEIACKPGQTGDGIRTRITVSGATASASASTKAKYDREIEIEVKATEILGADGLTAKTGERIEFKLENKVSAKRKLEIIDPSGKVVALIEADADGAAETIVELGAAGTWTVKIEGAGVAAIEKTLAVA